MFIDIHVHTRGKVEITRAQNPAYSTPEQLLDRYEKLQIERAVLLPGISPECAYMPQSNEEILDICERHTMFIPFCNIDPRAMSNSANADLTYLMKHYKGKGCKGIGEMTANLPVLHPKVQNFFKCAQEADMPVTIHMAPQLDELYGIQDDPGLPQLERTLQKFPKLKIFAHSQVFWAEIGRLDTVTDRYGYPHYPISEEGTVPKLMRKHKHLYGDLSARSGCNALTRDENYAVKFLNEFQDKLMFGTDISAPSTPTPLVDFLLKLKESGRISETVFKKVAKKNAFRILELK
ncbi:MAG: amidohydrolase family protein [Victivallales bacterium]|nr:amidohydrolase family protein [Victivallales bacterium]